MDWGDQMNKLFIYALLVMMTIFKCNVISAEISKVHSYNPSAVSVSLGEAITAYSYEGYSLIDNPGGLARQKKQWDMSYSSLFGQVSQSYMSVSYPLLNKLSSWVGSIGVQNVSVDGIEEASVTGRKTGNTFGYSRYDTYLGMARSSTYQSLIHSVHYGVAVHTIYESLYGTQGFGWGLDMGLIAEIGSRWQLGFSIDNLKPAIVEWNTESQTSEQLSTTSKLGLGYQLTDYSRISVDFGDASPKVGGLITLLNRRKTRLYLRGGIGQYLKSLGVGIVLGIFQMDYAYQSQDASYMSPTHRMSVRVSN